MNNSAANNKNSKLTSSIFFFMLFFMVSFSGHSQSEKATVAQVGGNETTAAVKMESARVSNNLEFALWFMATKQDPNTTVPAEQSNARKSIITSGMAPNRLLIKALLKKVVNYESSLT